MTDTTTTSPDSPLLEHIDPALLLVDANLRGDAAPDKTLVDSVRDLGVLVPLVAVRSEEGVRVRYGHRRARAAVQAGRASVPVWVIEAEQAGGDVDRIVRQWAENEHRASLTDADRLAAVEQLAAFGISAAQITRRLRAPRAHVDAALTTAKSTAAKTAVDEHGLDLTQAATLVEFDDDPDTVELLVAAAQDGPGVFAHAAQRARDARQVRAREQAARDTITASGVPVLDGRSPGHGAAGGIQRLSSLNGQDGQPLTPAAHAACPGHAAYLVVEYGCWTSEQAATVLLVGTPDADPGEGDQYDPEDLDPDEFDSDEPDSDEAGRPEVDEEPDDEDGQARDDRAWRGRYAAAYVCTDYQAHGHTSTWTRHDSPGQPAEPESEQQEDERKETARLERRRIIDNNKAWKSAEAVRKDWLRLFLTRKTLPKGAAGFLARRLAAGSHEFSRAAQEGHPLACELLGVEHAGGYYASTPTGLNTLLDTASDSRAQVITLGLVLAACEAATDTHSWRNVNHTTAAYLHFLTDSGYDLADVERLACGQVPLPDLDQTTDQTTDQATDADTRGTDTPGGDDA